MSIVSDDFETDTGHFVAWYGSPTITHSTADAHTGTGSLSIVPGAAFYGVTQSTFNGYGGITAGQQYTSSIWVKARVGTVGQHVMQVQWLDNANAQISSVDTTFTPGASWAQVTRTLTAPAGAVRINLGLLANGTGDVATEWLADDFDISAAGASLTGDVTATSTLGVSIVATRTAGVDEALGVTLGSTVTAVRTAGVDAALTQTFGVTAAATRTAGVDAALAQTFGVTATAVRQVSAAVSIGLVAGLVSTPDQTGVVPGAHTSTAVGDAVSAIVTAMRARAGYRSPWTSGATGIPVFHSVEVGLSELDVAGSEQLLVIADVGDPEQPLEAGSSGFQAVTLGTTRQKEEKATIRCRAIAQTGDVGDGVIQAQWDAALDLVDAVDDELRSLTGIGPTLGLSPPYRSLIATVSQVTGVLPHLAGGVVVEVTFDIEVVTRL
jgi:hypothetical protein